MTIEMIKPNENLKKLGFSDVDIINLNIALESTNLNLIKNDLEVTNLMDLSFYLLSDKDFKKTFLNNYIIKDVKKEENKTLFYKWNLMINILSIDSKKETLDNKIKEILEEIKDEKRSYNSLIDAFLEMKREPFNDTVSAYNLCSKVAEIERSGWVIKKVGTFHKESIAEHMYNMYLMAAFFLPEKMDDKEYDKNKILKMIMIHDLAETLTGDIPNPSKKEADEVREDLKAKSIWCKLIYDGNQNGKIFYDLWEEWYYSTSINSLIAHDFDIIQLIYQFMTYATLYKDTFSSEDVLSWTKRKPVTEIGKKIYQEVITNNPKFKERSKEIYGKENSL